MVRGARGAPHSRHDRSCLPPYAAASDRREDVTRTATKKPKRTPEEIVRALLDKTLENGCTQGEEAAAVAKAEELIVKHGLERSAFKFPPKREDKRKRDKEGRTIRDFCEELLSRKPPLSYDDIL